jgi:regulator of protease activity HflC (stomatin/prohibitin superfamily)
MSSFSTATATGQEPALELDELEAQRSENEQPSPVHSGQSKDPYRGAVLVLLVATFVAALSAVTAGWLFQNVILLDVAVTLGIATGILCGVALAQRERATPPAPIQTSEILSADTPVVTPPESPEVVPTDATPPASRVFPVKRLLVRIAVDLRDRLFNVTGRELISRVKISIGAAGLAGIGLVLLATLAPTAPDLFTAAAVAGVCFIAAGLSATAVRYLRDLDPASLPEAAGLCRGARVVAWVLVLAALSMGLAWVQQQAILSIVHLAILLLNAAICSSLIEKSWRRKDTLQPATTFPLDLTILTVLGNRANIVASVLDAGEQQLGIDLRSTWALTIVRNSVEPLIIGLCLTGWLSTSLTVVGLEEQGLVERLGVPVAGAPLSPGLHVHWPWPIDQVFRIPVMRVQVLTVGHEGQEEGGPENVLWAVQHAANEYTLLLGNGRDLITIDAGVQFRISDAKAWRYHTQNPKDALSAIAYRAVMRNTVNRTLSEALSENVVMLTNEMRAAVQKDADALGLGVEVMGFTVGGMHPPVAVAPDYQAVVSAELGKVTAVVSAQAYRNRTVPSSEAYVVGVENTARAEGAQELGAAAGEAWAFRTLESQYRASPQEYLFRRRLETLEKGLFGKGYTVVDSRFQRDGGELWVIP